MIAISSVGNIGTYRSGWFWLNGTNDPVLAIDTWYHIVYAQNSTGIDLYLDGSWVSQLTPNRHIETSALTHIGSGTGGGRPAKAVLDEVAAFNVRLTAAEIQQLYLKGSTLPVEFFSFEAHKSENTIQLNWTTASELNNDFFTIERSLDRRTFQAIGKVAGVGTSSEWHSYSFLDQHPLDGRCYYRIKQTDFDGASDYSKVIEVAERAREIEVYPNPVQDILIIEIPVEAEAMGAVSVALFDLSGKALEKKTYMAENNIIQIDFSSRPKGIYYVNVLDPVSGKNVIRKIMK